MFKALALLFVCCVQPMYSTEALSREEALEEESPMYHQVSDVRGLFIKTFGLLAGLCGLVVVGGYLLKRIGPKGVSFGADGAIVLVERKYISPKTALWLVKVNGQPLLVVDSQNGVAIQNLREEKT